MEDFSKEDALNRLAKQIKKFRKQKGVSQQNAYNDTGIHFARIEQGKRDISFTTLIRICKYLNISLTDFSI